MVKDNSYITIQSFMINDLQLKGNELLVYAIIFSFSQDGESHYTGSLSYLADWTNSTKRGVIDNLKSLVGKGYIGKVEKTINKVKFCEYYAKEIIKGGEKSSPGYRTKFTGGGEKSSPNKLIDKIEDNLFTARQNEIVDKSVYYPDKVLIGNDFKIDFEDDFFYPYRRAGTPLVLAVQRWIIRNFNGEIVEKGYICRQIGNFAKKQGCYDDLIGG